MTTADLRVMTIVGTRPEIIRLARVIAKLDLTCDHLLVHTRQNYDPNLGEVFFEELAIRRPNRYLDVAPGSLGRMLGDSFGKIEAALEEGRPDAVLVLGDTNSALTAFVAKRMGITVFHMEAGNRSFDANVPEETNRKVIDHFADINLVYTEHARRNLLSEGLEPRKIYLTGSPLFEVIEYYRPRIASSNVLERLDLERGSYFLLSMHREENVDNAPRLASLLAGVGDLAQHYGLPVVSTTHPRTRQRLGALGDLADAAAIRFLEPFSYLDYLALQCSARCVISDSGSIAEEAAMLDVPAVTVRDAIERPEALDTGGVVLAGAAPGGLLDAVRTMLASRERCTTRMIPPEYAVPDCSERVVKCIVGMTRLQPRWDNLDRPKRRVAR